MEELQEKEDELREKELQDNWRKWQGGLIKQRMKENTDKTDCREVLMIADSGNIKLKQADKFKYLGVALSDRQGSEKSLRARLNAAWNKWKEVSGLIYDKRMQRKLKVTIYKPSSG